MASAMASAYSPPLPSTGSSRVTLCIGFMSHSLLKLEFQNSLRVREPQLTNRWLANEILLRLVIVGCPCPLNPRSASVLHAMLFGTCTPPIWPHNLFAGRTANSWPSCLL